MEIIRYCGRLKQDSNGAVSNSDQSQNQNTCECDLIRRQLKLVCLFWANNINRCRIAFGLLSNLRVLHEQLYVTSAFRVRPVLFWMWMCKTLLVNHSAKHQVSFCRCHYVSIIRYEQATNKLLPDAIYVISSETTNSVAWFNVQQGVTFGCKSVCFSLELHQL